MTGLLDATGLVYAAGDTRLVSGVSLDTAAGEVVAVVGPNGAGKSTLLRLLAGDLAPTTGDVRILDEPVAGAALGDLALRRSFLGQHPASDVPFIVSDVVTMGRHPHRGRPENTADADRDAVDSALDATDTQDVANRVFATLSGGEQQRVNVARILAQEAPVTLLDEPTAALDIGHQELVMQSLRTVAGSGGAVVAVLHDLNLAAVFADRVLLLDGGKVVSVGTPQEVLREQNLSSVYRHPVRVIDHPFRDGRLVLPVDE